jgi:hypothetical protein
MARLSCIEQEACQRRIIVNKQCLTYIPVWLLLQPGATQTGGRTKLVSVPRNSAVNGVSLLAFSVALRYLSLMSDDPIEKLARKLAETVPEGLRSMREDLEANFRGVLRSGLSKLDLVTREEFDVQEAVLRRTREKLDRLEAQLEEIEKSAS